MSSTKLLLNPAPPQPHKVMGFKLSKEALELITTHVAGGNPPKIQVQFGSNPTLVIGTQTFHFNMVPDTVPPYNVYRRSAVPPDPTALAGLSASKSPTAALDLVGSFTHRCTMRRELSDDLKHQMKSATAAAEHKSHIRQVKILEAGEAMQLGSSKHSMTGAAARGGGTTKSAAGAKGAVTPRGAVSTVTSPDSGRASESGGGGGIPLRQRLIQLLAKKDFSTESLISYSKALKKDVTTILNEIATAKSNSWWLKPEVYKEVRIWDWTFEDKEKKEVVNNVKKAYEKLNYPPEAKERANLIRPPAALKFSPSMVQTQAKKLKPESESRNVKRPKADLASTDSSTDTKPKTTTKKVRKAAATPTPTNKRVSAATDGARKANSSTTTTKLKPTPPSANGKPPLPSASSSSSSGLTNGGGAVANGTTPKRAVQTIDDLLSTANGTAVVSSAKEAKHVNGGPKRKERGEDGGGGGGGEGVKAGGYKIRKKGAVAPAGAGTGAGAGAGTVRETGTEAEKEDGLDALDVSKPYNPPRITTQTEYHHLCLHFKDKYDEYHRADVALDKHRDLIDALRDVDRLQRPSTTDASAAKHKYEEYGGKEGRWGEVLKTAERYVKLHKELEAIKAELWRAYDQGIGGANSGANSGANGVVNGAGGGT